jgi:hypothetical protein
MATNLFGRVGRIYDTYNGRECYEYDCTFGPTISGGCCHFCCRMSALRSAGRDAVAVRLEANAKARDWLDNWGKLLYDPRQHGRDAKRRKAAAEVILAMRRQAMGYADAVTTGAWAGALLGAS